MAMTLDLNRSTTISDDETLLAKVPLRVVDQEKIPSRRYYDKAFFDLEREKLWPHVWQMACRLEEVAEVGDYVEYKILDRSVIVVRTKNGVKAFHNACRHRGLTLVEGAGNCKTKGFVCPFHGWRWNMEGENTFVFGKQIFSEELLDKAELSLVPCRLETWGGHAFINFDDDAPSLLDSLGPVAERLGIRNPDGLKMEWWYATELPTNWKLAMEAFMEGYHTMKTHPQLQDLSAFNPYGPDADGPTLIQKDLDSRGHIDLFTRFLARLSSGMAGMVHSSEVKIAESLAGMDLPEDPMAAYGVFLDRLKTEIHQQGVANGLPIPDLNAADLANPHRTVEFLFPHYFLLPFYGSMSAYRIRPLTPETCLFEIWSLAFLPDDPAREPVKAPIVLPYDSTDFPEIPRQDYENLPRQQRGLHAVGFDYMRLSKDAEGLISNYNRLIDGYLAELDPAKLAKAQHLTNDGFEHPIVDIGF
ncbi:Carnitine monooxygenase oxygenase subunit [Brevundimonas sp. NIBR10]|uniref:aromatic ring-hydroxylating oxygenase subunit alpha n=1 Tax=Brevundimonas sp. NIBR10 TaxID=3015997 RepID=UPI0022F1B8A6|nr:aromatic ring-hydroxylating dioxygenase subunit alpha [Brevundimonas sp. NIBR10]WGM47522.1 Carnitine monooxygenase oxygenase subunit [Brevundimonas sp. NIBR10]